MLQTMFAECEVDLHYACATLPGAWQQQLQV
jgi:hypothetical protein